MGDGGVFHTSSVYFCSVYDSYTLRYVSLAELGNVCQVGLREPIHLCTCVSEEGGDGEGAGSELVVLIFFIFMNQRNQKYAAPFTPGCFCPGRSLYFLHLVRKGRAASAARS
jgi:hypothetical protein